MSKFDEFVSAVLKEVEKSAADLFASHRKQAEEDAKAFLAKTREDMERWAGAVASGQMTASEFEFLVRGKKDLAELAALKQAGLAVVALEKFREGLVKAIVGTAARVLV
jgi:hypothetical protein